MKRTHYEVLLPFAYYLMHSAVQLRVFNLRPHNFSKLDGEALIY